MGYRETIYDEYLSLEGSDPLLSSSFKTRAPIFRHLIKHYFPKNKSARIIDLGCGSGALVYFAKAAGYTQVFGVDCSPEQIAAGRSQGVETLTQSGIQTYLSELPADSQDVIVTFDIVEHLKKDELLALAKNIFTVLREGGRWIVHTVNAESPFFGRIRYGDYTHEIAFTRSSLSQVFRASGFKHFSCYEDKPIVHGVKSFIRSIIWRVIRSFWRFCLMAETGEKQGVFSQNFLMVAEKTI